MAQSSHGIKERAIAEAREFFVVFAYVWLLFAVFGLHKSVILTQAHIVEHQGAAIIKAAAFAKLIFVAEKLRFGEIFEEKPLIWPTLFKSVVFAVMLVCMDIAENALIEKFWPHANADASGDIDIGSPRMIASVGLLTFAALIPFFGMRELSKVLGGSRLYELFLVRRRNFTPQEEEANPASYAALDETEE